MDPERLQRYATELKPPLIELVGEDANSPDTWKKRREYLQETWDSFAAPLRQEKRAEALEAYRALRELREGLERRLEEMQKKVRRHENQVRYYGLLGWLCREKLREHGPEEKVRAALPEEDLRQYESQRRDGPEGRATKGSSLVLSDALGPPWSAEVSVAGPGADRVKVTVGLSPSDKRLRDYGVDAEALLRKDPVRLEGGETWAEALERIEERARPHEKYLRTAEVLRFRLSVVENVLYQFEVLGEPQEMSAEEADRAIENIEDTVASRAIRYRHALTCIEALKLYREKGKTIQERGDRTAFQKFIERKFRREDARSGKAVVAGCLRVLKDLGESCQSFHEDFEGALKRQEEEIIERTKDIDGVSAARLKGES